MADVSDVLNALATIAAGAVLPNGNSITGNPILIYPGWPSSATLDADLSQGKCHISVFPKQEERNTTRYQKTDYITTPAAPTITATVSGQKITIGGQVGPHNIAVLISGSSYVYAVQQTDTVSTIAAAIAALIGGTSSGSTVTALPTQRIQAVRVGASATVTTEVRRQQRLFMVTVWANSPQMRDLVSAAIDTALAQIEFLTFPDGFTGRLIYAGSPITDSLQKAYLYRRDLNYQVEYPTTVSSLAPQVVTTVTNVTQNGLSTTTINQ